MKDSILFMDVKGSHTKPLLLFDITAPISLVIASKSIYNHDIEANEVKKEVMDGVRVYVYPEIRKIEVCILYGKKEWREFYTYYHNINIKSYTQFPVLSLAIEDNTWEIKIMGNFESKISYDESCIERILTDETTRQFWDIVSDKDMELSLVVSNPTSFTLMSAYGGEIKGPQTVRDADAVNIYCNQASYSIKIEVVKDNEVVFGYLVKVRSDCFIKGLLNYPDKMIMITSADHKWLCSIAGTADSNAAIKGGFLKNMVDNFEKTKFQQETEQKERQKMQMQKLLNIIDGKYKPTRPQKIMKFNKPDNVFIFASASRDVEMELYEGLSEVEIHYAPEATSLILFMKKSGALYPTAHSFPCKDWYIMWDTSAPDTEDYCFCSDNDTFFTVSSGKDTKIEYFMDIYDRIEIVPKG